MFSIIHKFFATSSRRKKCQRKSKYFLILRLTYRIRFCWYDSILFLVIYSLTEMHRITKYLINKYCDSLNETQMLTTLWCLQFLVYETSFNIQCLLSHDMSAVTLCSPKQYAHHFLKKKALRYVHHHEMSATLKKIIITLCPPYKTFVYSQKSHYHMPAALKFRGNCISCQSD